MNINYKTFKTKKKLIQLILLLILMHGFFQEMEQNSVCALFQLILHSRKDLKLMSPYMIRKEIKHFLQN